ncbi:hypothetical protein CG709_17250 [Lachnotalea glycerini]|nr:hypothetical protein CG709_17250 [Lachnotalea glycerini]
MENLQVIEELIGEINEEVLLYYDYVSPKFKRLLDDLYLQKEATDETLSQSVAITLLQYISEKRTYISGYIYSFLCRYEFSDELMCQYIDFVVRNTHLKANTKFFIYHQIRFLLEENNIPSTQRRYLMWRLYNSSADLFKLDDFKELSMIPKDKRNENLIIIITDKFIEEEDESTLKALECSKAVITDLHKNVLLINTAERLSQKGAVEYYQIHTSEYIQDKIYEQSINWKGVSIPYFQCDNNMPDKATIDTLIDTIEQLKPMCVIDLGRSMLAKLAQNVVPVIEAATTASEIKQKILNIDTKKEIILSICIPSYNRGHRALELIERLMDVPKELEVEFVISNNGSIRNQEGYAKIKEYAKRDERIIYNEFEENQLFLGNFWKVILMANGKYAMLISDEDNVIIENIREYINLLKYNESLGVVRSAGIGAYYSDGGEVYARAGDEAFNKFFLGNNYMTGIIYRTDFITEEFSKKLNETYKDNIAYLYYPHEFVDMYLCLHYDFCKYNLPIFEHGKSEDEVASEIKYRNYESRFAQHTGFTELLAQVQFQSAKAKVRAYTSLCWKTFFLISLRKRYYQNDYTNICDQCKQLCLDSVKQLGLGEMTEAVTADISQIIDKYYNKFCLGE